MEMMKMNNNQRCRSCNEDSGYDIRPLNYHAWARSDAYGVYTGVYCDDCYESDKYPYRKDYYYDESYAGERMDDDY